MKLAILSGAIQNYAWGSHRLLAEFMGRPAPSPLPEAELWFGAHPVGPSTLEQEGIKLRLDAVIEQNPSEQLGRTNFERFGRLPFLLKVLAVERPLSIQAHPSVEQALSGFNHERARGISPTDARANYRDDWAKPELLCPLTEFEALCGFRPLDELVRQFEALGGECFLKAARLLKELPEPEALKTLISSWLGAAGSNKSALLHAGLTACQTAAQQDHPAHAAACLALDLAALNPDDTGALVALTLRHLKLRPGHGLFVPAGFMHAYLRGMAVEVMASSDNVLRGGLTRKHVDVPELLKVACFACEAPQVVELADANFAERRFECPAAQFEMSLVDVSFGSHWCTTARRGPEMFLCVNGALKFMSPTHPTIDMVPGQCIWVAAAHDVYCVAGKGRGYRVQVGM